MSGSSNACLESLSTDPGIPERMHQGDLVPSANRLSVELNDIATAGSVQHIPRVVLEEIAYNRS